MRCPCACERERAGQRERTVVKARSSVLKARERKGVREEGVRAREREGGQGGERGTRGGARGEGVEKLTHMHSLRYVCMWKRRSKQVRERDWIAECTKDF